MIESDGQPERRMQEWSPVQVSHAAVLCPSFYKARIVTNPSAWDRFADRVRGAVIGWVQRRDARARARLAF